MNTEHFHGLVPTAVKDKLLEIAEELYDDLDLVVTGFKRHGLLGCCNLNQIYGYHVSGFIPFQQGGFVVSDLAQSDEDSSYHFCAAQTEFVSQQVKACESQFRHDFELPEDFEWDSTSEGLQEQYYDYQHEWLEPALFYVEMFADGYKDDNPHVVFRVGVNYRDAPYFREKYGTDVRTLALDENEFLATPIADIIQQLEV